MHCVATGITRNDKLEPLDQILDCKRVEGVQKSLTLHSEIPAGNPPMFRSAVLQNHLENPDVEDQSVPSSFIVKPT